MFGQFLTALAKGNLNLLYKIVVFHVEDILEELQKMKYPKQRSIWCSKL